MPAIRIDDADQIALAVEDLVAIANASSRLFIAPGGPPHMISIEIGSRAWPSKVVARAALSARDASALVASEPRLSHTVVADQISEEAKDYLSRVPGWGWLDRRTGSLRIADEAFVYESDVPKVLARKGRTLDAVQLARSSADGAIRGRAGISYAAALLRSTSDDRPTIRGVAAAANMAPSSISEAASRLRSAGLVLESGEPVLPDLFWDLAAIWKPLRVAPVARRPGSHNLDPMPINLEDLAAEGWAQGGDEAAAGWGAPMFIGGSRPWLWVPSQVDARRAERRLGPAAWEDCTAVVAVPPTRLVCQHRMEAPQATLDWPTPHPVFLALELAQDRSRGHEILEGWTPLLPMRRPWELRP